MARHRTVFLDTNSLLQFRWIAEIDWLGLLNASSVDLILAPVVIAEIDRHKYGSSRRLRDRARDLLPRLQQAFDAHEVRPSVALRYVTKEPSLDFATRGLARDSQDDRLIAAVLQLVTERPDVDVALATNDLGLSLKAREHHIEVIKLPQDYALADEPDPTELRAQKAEAELQQYKNRRPDLRVTFSDKANYRKFVLPRTLTEASAGARIAALRAQHQPYRVASAADASTGQLGLAAFMAASMVSRPTDEEVARYNRELEQFFAASNAYYCDVWPQHEGRNRRTLKLELFLTNRGTAVAEDIHVVIHIPDGVAVYAEEDLPRVPEPPEPPKPPRTSRELLLEPFSRLALMSDIPALSKLSTIGQRQGRPSIRRTGSFDVTYTFTKLLHGFVLSLDPIYVEFESDALVRSFHVAATAHCATLARPAVEELHVVVQRNSAPAESQ